MRYSTPTEEQRQHLELHAHAMWCAGVAEGLGHMVGVFASHDHTGGLRNRITASCLLCGGLLIVFDGSEYPAHHWNQLDKPCAVMAAVDA